MSRENLKLRKAWVVSKPKFLKEGLEIKNFQVMQWWEKNYMKELAKVVTSKGGDVLEVGFGLGISANYIQKEKKIKTHTVIECHPKLMMHICEKFKGEIAVGRMIPICGFWEDVTPKLRDESFDGILFDTSPIEKEVKFFHFFPFFKEAYRLLKKGGIFTYFSDEEEKFSRLHLKKLKKAGFSKIDYRIIKVSPPEFCRYWKKNTILVPLISK